MFTVSKTYEIITEESAENGEAAERGFTYQDNKMTLKELIREVEHGGFCLWSSEQPVCSRDWINTVDPDINYKTGEHKFYALHITGKEKHFDTLVKILKERR